MRLVVELVALFTGDLVKPDSLLDELVGVVSHDEPLVELDLAHAHLAVGHESAVRLVDQRYLEERLVVRVVEQVLGRVLERLLVVLLDLSLVEAHHVRRHEPMLLEEVPEALALHLLRVEALPVHVFGLGRVPDQAPPELVGHDYQVAVSLFEEPVVAREA